MRGLHMAHEDLQIFHDISFATCKSWQPQELCNEITLVITPAVVLHVQSIVGSALTHFWSRAYLIALGCSMLLTSYWLHESASGNQPVHTKAPDAALLIMIHYGVTCLIR